MRFWDTSSIVPLLIAERRSGVVEGLVRSDGGRVVWWSARTECLSALHRRMRERDLDAAGLSAARARLFSFTEHSDVVLPSEAIRARAERLLAVHPLRAADAFHLAAALIVSEERPGDLPFITLDDRLGEAAGREGFLVLPG